MKIFNNNITKNSLFNTIPQEEIFEKYLGQTDKVGQGLIFNTIRDEIKPSVSYKYYGDILMAKDFADWEFYGDCVDWAKLYYKYVLNIEYTDFEILNVILEDFDSTLSTIDYKFKKPEAVEKEYAKIRIEARIYQDQLVYSMKDKIYWNKFGITEDTLREFGVISCSKVWIDTKRSNEFYRNGLIFAYRYGEGLYKIYQPEEIAALKWRSNIPTNEAIDNIGLDYSGQTTHIFYDNDFKSKDNPGQKSAARFVEKFNLVNIVIPKRFVSTDISEFRYNYGEKKTREFLLEAIGDPTDKLILTKSRKDRMVLKTFGYASYALQTEGLIPSELPY